MVNVVVMVVGMNSSCCYLQLDFRAVVLIRALLVRSLWGCHQQPLNLPGWVQSSCHESGQITVKSSGQALVLAVVQLEHWWGQSNHKHMQMSFFIPLGLLRLLPGFAGGMAPPLILALFPPFSAGPAKQLACILGSSCNGSVPGKDLRTVSWIAGPEMASVTNYLADLAI